MLDGNPIVKWFNLIKNKNIMDVINNISKVNED